MARDRSEDRVGMSSSSNVYRSPAHHRSPSAVFREMPHSPQMVTTPHRRASFRHHDDVKPHDLLASPSKARPPRTFYRDRGRSLAAVSQTLALPRRLRKPAGLLFLIIVGTSVLLYLSLTGWISAFTLLLVKGVMAIPALLLGPRPEVYTGPTHHTYHPNGYLLVNIHGKHPILNMIEKAEQEWNEKVARQSTTLEEAATEYRRRYKRNPPKGFEFWWAYVQANEVPLPDEYDQIDRDLKAYEALDLADMRHRNNVMQERGGTFTLAIKDGAVSIRGDHADLRRATDIADIIRRFSKDVQSEVNMTFIIEDQPAVMMSYERRLRMRELAEDGVHIGPSDFLGDQDDAAESELSNYARSCASHSPLRQSEMGELVSDFSPASGQRSFIWNHPKTMDICQHPEWRELHGLSATKGVGLGPLVPLFTFAKMTTHDDILATPLEQYWDSYEGYDPVWDQKKQNRLLWRGTTTGADFSTHFPWRKSQRARLHFMTHEVQGRRTVLNAIDEEGNMKLENISRHDLNILYMDTAFAGSPAQCDVETCQWMDEHIDFAPTQGLDDSYQYKYMMDVDGNGWSGRFHRLMSTRSLVLKSTIFPEWYADRLQPWYHYVPIKIDYADLYDVMSFFVGSVDGRGGHDELANRLAENGRKWAQTHWRRVDMAAYMFRLVLEYSRLLHGDENDVDYLG